MTLNPEVGRDGHVEERNTSDNAKDGNGGSAPRVDAEFVPEAGTGQHVDGQKPKRRRSPKSEAKQRAEMAEIAGIAASVRELTETTERIAAQLSNRSVHLDDTGRPRERDEVEDSLTVFIKTSPITIVLDNIKEAQERISGELRKNALEQSRLRRKIDRAILIVVAAVAAILSSAGVTIYSMSRRAAEASPACDVAKTIDRAINTGGNRPIEELPIAIAAIQADELPVDAGVSPDQAANGNAGDQKKN